MPLVAINKVHKFFPESFAERFSERFAEHAKRRSASDAGVDQVHTRRDQLKKKQDAVFAGNQQDAIKRPRTPIDSNGENSAENEAPDITSGTTEHAPMTGVETDFLSQAWWAVRPKSSGSCARSASRTTVSLDSVDLWESDSEECDTSVTKPCSATNNKDGFDRINGVVINPRKTFDFSDLRRSRSPMIREGHVTTERSRRHVRDAGKPSTETPTDRKQSVAERLKYLQQRQKELEAEKSQKEKDEKQQEQLAAQQQKDKERDKRKERVETEKEMRQIKSILSPPKEAFTENCRLNKKDLSQSAMFAFGGKGKPRVRLVPGLHTLPASNDSLKTQTKNRPGSYHSSDTRMTNRPESNCSLNMQMTNQPALNYCQDTRTTNRPESNRSLNTQMTNQPASNYCQDTQTTNQPESNRSPNTQMTNCPVSNHSLNMQTTKRTSQTCVSSDVFPSNSVTDAVDSASVTYPLTARTESRRKVKFNTVVSVRDGERNIEDTLRSSKNSAQIYKRKYLLGIPTREETVMEESPRPTTPTPPSDLPCYQQWSAGLLSVSQV